MNKEFNIEFYSAALYCTVLYCSIIVIEDVHNHQIYLHISIYQNKARIKLEFMVPNYNKIRSDY